MENFPKNISFENTFEKSQNEFSLQLQKIIHTEITDKNIKTFANNSMRQLISLIDKIKNAYQKETNSNLTGKNLEDRALAYYNLRDINELLSKIQEKKDQITEIYEYIKNIPKDDKIIVPPGQLRKGKISKGDIPWERKNNSPRLATLLYILESDFNIPKENVDVTEGLVSNNQMRTEPYYRLEINELNRVVYVCIEEGNVTYIFDKEKLKKNGIDIEDLDNLTKKQGNELLQKYEDIGTKLNYSKFWRENITNLLNNQNLNYKTTNTSQKKINPETTTTKENVPRVAKGEFDEWRGFWTDENGKHWAPITTLDQKIKLGISNIKKLAENRTFKSIKDIMGHERDSYCYEDIQDTIAKEKLMRKEKNQWKNFYIDEDGKHWAPERTLNDYTNIGRNNSSYIKDLPSKRIKSNSGREEEVYCYEDYIQTPAFKKRMEKEKEGIYDIANEDNFELNQWKDFYTDKNGNHWSTKNILATKTNIPFHKIMEITQKLPKINLRTSVGPIRNGYCYESIIETPEFTKQIEKNQILSQSTIHEPSPETNLDLNQWRNFYTDTDGKHWADVDTMAQYMGINKSSLNEYSKQKSTKTIRTLDTNRIRPGFCYEELIKDPKIIEKIQRAQKRQEIEKNSVVFQVSKKDIPESNRWALFYTDNQDRHWGTQYTIAQKAGIQSIQLDEIINKFPTKNIIDGAGVIRTGYCYEHLLADPEILYKIEIKKEKKKKRQNLPHYLVSKEDNIEKNQWKHFYTDESGKHWATTSLLTKKICSDYKINSAYETIKKYSTKLPQKSIVDVKNNERQAYCYEDLIQLPEIKKLINDPSVATENNLDKNLWYGFWTDENGKHWGHVGNLAKLVGASSPTISKYIEILHYKEIKDLSGISRPAYCYEDLIQIPEIQELLKNKKG